MTKDVAVARGRPSIAVDTFTGDVIAASRRARPVGVVQLAGAAKDF